MGTVYVKPIEGALVRMPGTMTPLSKDGMFVSLDGDEGSFWRRRIHDGSVVIIEQPTEAVAPIVQAESTPPIDESAKSDRQRRRA